LLIDCKQSTAHVSLEHPSAIAVSVTGHHRDVTGPDIHSREWRTSNWPGVLRGDPSSPSQPRLNNAIGKISAAKKRIDYSNAIRNLNRIGVSTSRYFPLVERVVRNVIHT
jgi:hypothetical protein